MNLWNFSIKLSCIIVAPHWKSKSETPFGNNKYMKVIKRPTGGEYMVYFIHHNIILSTNKQMLNLQAYYTFFLYNNTPPVKTFIMFANKIQKSEFSIKILCFKWTCFTWNWNLWRLSRYNVFWSYFLYLSVLSADIHEFNKAALVCGVWQD